MPLECIEYEMQRRTTDEIVEDLVLFTRWEKPADKRAY
jgi:hypothetical protein